MFLWWKKIPSTGKNKDFMLFGIISQPCICESPFAVKYDILGFTKVSYVSSYELHLFLLVLVLIWNDWVDGAGGGELSGGSLGSELIIQCCTILNSENNNEQQIWDICIPHLVWVFQFIIAAHSSRCVFSGQIRMLSWANYSIEKTTVKNGNKSEQI